MNEKQYTEKRKNLQDRRKETDTLDRFAFLAMQALLQQNQETPIPFQRIAQESYIAAKSMMATRAHFNRRFEESDDEI